MSSTFIRAVECWVPGVDRSLLEFGGGLYGEARRLGNASRGLCFGFGEGLPGQAWEAGRPVVLKDLSGGNFRRSGAALADGLSCGIALPIFAGEVLTSVLVIFCGDDEAHAGAIELWHNDPAASKDMTLVDGYYGTTGEAFEYSSRRTAFAVATACPAWPGTLACRCSWTTWATAAASCAPTARCRWASTAASRCRAAAWAPGST